MQALGGAIYSVLNSSAMGYVTSALKFVGGGSASTGAMTLLTAGTTLAQAEMSAQEMEQKASREEIRGKDEEIMRRRNLIASMAAQNVALGARGIKFEGSEAASRDEQFNVFGYESGVSSALSRSAQAGYRGSAAGTRIAGGVRTAATLMGPRIETGGGTKKPAKGSGYGILN